MKEALEVLFNTSINYFWLTARLRVVGGAHLEFSTWLLKNYCQKLLMKIRSQSLTMERGMPWSLRMFWIKVVATPFVVYGCVRARKWADLLNCSTTTSMMLFPLEWRSHSIKFIVILSYTWQGIVSGCKSPTGVKESALAFWQMSHADIYFCISLYIDNQ